MLFTSTSFAVFCLACLALYYLVPSRISKFDNFRENVQVAVLLVASMVFYSFGDPRLSVLLAISIVSNATVAWLLAAPTSMKATSRRRLVFYGVSLNLVILAFFKYALFLVEFLAPSGLEASLAPRAASIPLPIGISFFTFQGISLIVDMTRDGNQTLAELRLRRERGFVPFFAAIGFYIAFFPQLIAGPIVKAHDFLPQIGKRSWKDINWAIVARALISGFFLKLFVADNLSGHTAALVAGDFDGRTKLDLFLLVYGYSCQIFADFAGYSLIAIGLGALFGYRIPINFRSPYISQSITEFWRRWHISLSGWLRDYLYLPLGGNRAGPMRTYLNLMIVMVLGGLWHGASLNFVVWGLAHGVLLALERLLFGRQVLSRSRSSIGALRAITCFGVVSLLWLVFAAPDFSSTVSFYSNLASGPLGLNVLNGTIGLPTLFGIAFFAFPVLLHHLWSFRFELDPGESAVRVGSISSFEALFLGSMLFLSITDAGISGDFIYFKF